MIRAVLLSILVSFAALAEDVGVPFDAGVPVEPSADAGVELAGTERATVIDDGEEEEGVEPGDGEQVDARASAQVADGVLYSAELSDEALLRLWTDEPGALGSISVGLVEAGRLINGVPMPSGDAWHVVDPHNAFGTQETVEFIQAAANAVRAQFAEAPVLRINHIGKQSGGYIRPHQSHQAGRDVDLGFYYPAGEDPGRLSKKRELAMDLPMNWALIKALITSADVQFILVDKRIQARLYDFALKLGEDKAWLDKLFHSGFASLIRHARGHRDHFHVRFYSGRSQELGRRIAPLLARQPEQNLIIHRVKSGDTLGALAVKYNSGVKLIQKANGMTNTALRVGRTLNIPLRGPCTNCPVPPPLVVPPRCLPPEPPPKS